MPPYYLAAKSGHDSVLLALIPLWAEVDSAEKELFFRAVNDVNAELNPLHVAAREGLIRVVKAFISAGADMLYADKVKCLQFSIFISIYHNIDKNAFKFMPIHREDFLVFISQPKLVNVIW